MPGFPDLFTFLKKLLSPHRTRPELDFLFHFWLLPSYSCSRYSPPFPCILLCGSLSWLLCLTETLRGNERCGRRNNGAGTTISPPELVFPGHGPVCPSLKSTVSLSHRCREKVMRQPRVIYWVTLLSIVPRLCKEGLKAALHPHAADETRHSDNELQPGGASGVLCSGQASMGLPSPSLWFHFHRLHHL